MAPISSGAGAGIGVSRSPPENSRHGRNDVVERLGNRPQHDKGRGKTEENREGNCYSGNKSCASDVCLQTVARFSRLSIQILDETSNPRIDGDAVLAS